MIAKNWTKAFGVVVFLLLLGALFLVKRVIFDELLLRYASMLLIGILAGLGTERFANARNNLDYAVSVVSFALAFYTATDLLVN